MRVVLVCWFSPILCWFFGHKLDEYTEQDNDGNITNYYQYCVRCGKITIQKEY